MSNLELKIHPPIVLVLCAILAWIISNVFAMPVAIENSLTTALAVLLTIVGVAIAACAILEFRRAGTTFDPGKPADSSALVTGGIFRFSRNPMYLSLSLVLSGWIVYLGNPPAIASLVVFIVYIGRFQIRPEERVLSSMFGKDYENYCREVRRWI